MSDPFPSDIDFKNKMVQVWTTLKIKYFSSPWIPFLRAILEVISRLVTYIGNIVDWKHKYRLETKFLDSKQWFEIGNTNRWLETCFRFMFPMYVSNVCFRSTYYLYILPMSHMIWVISYDPMFPISKYCFQCPFFCFQSTFYVSNLRFLFPNQIILFPFLFPI